MKTYNLATLLISNEAGREDLLKRIDKEIEIEQNEISRGEKMLGNPNFISKAPKEKIELEQNKLKMHRDNLAALLEKKQNI